MVNVVPLPICQCAPPPAAPRPTIHQFETLRCHVSSRHACNCKSLNLYVTLLNGFLLKLFQMSPPYPFFVFCSEIIFCNCFIGAQVAEEVMVYTMVMNTVSSSCYRRKGSSAPHQNQLCFKSPILGSKEAYR